MSALNYDGNYPDSCVCVLAVVFLVLQSQLICSNHLCFSISLPLYINYSHPNCCNLLINQYPFISFKLMVCFEKEHLCTSDQGEKIIYLVDFSPRCCHFAWSKIIEVVVLDYLNILAPFATFKPHTHILSIRTKKKKKNCGK